MSVKNRAPAPDQLTATQLIADAHASRKGVDSKETQLPIDDEELQEYKLQQRRRYEVMIRTNPKQIRSFAKYARWEAGLGEMRRARSIFERCIEINYREPLIWIHYAEMEMKYKFTNSARNIWDRAVSILPRVDQLWLKYIYMEEMLGEIQSTRTIFERWMQWQPSLHAWLAFINFELRYNCVEEARAIYARCVGCHPSPQTWLKWTRFESQHGNSSHARIVYERALDTLGDEGCDADFYLSFAAFEEKCNEYERARIVYTYALDHAQTDEVYDTISQALALFEKRIGSSKDLDAVLLRKRRHMYEQELKESPHAYDTWLDLIRLEKNLGTVNSTQNVFERAITHVPPTEHAEDKHHWKRYIYIWIQYLIYTELTQKSIAQTRELFQRVLKLIPHRVFTFAKIWRLFAEFELRQHNLPMARRILGQSLGQCPKITLFQFYIGMEYRLGYFNRCRTLYEKWLCTWPEHWEAWHQYAQFEVKNDEHERTRAIYELAIAQPWLNNPEQLWDAYIAYEVSQEAHARVRALYERLLSKASHIRVWIHFAAFETTIGNVEAARRIFKRGYEQLDGESRVMLTESWCEFEQHFGTSETLNEAQRHMPTQIKKKRPMMNDDGQTIGWEEYFEYVYETPKDHSNLLEMAKQWKQQHPHTMDG